MRKSIIALGLALVFQGNIASVYALSCLPTDMYLDTVVGDGTTQVFVGTATEVKNHTQVVTVTKALQGWVAPKVWVQHPWSSDWQYFCSNGPAKAGVPTVFLVTIDQYGSFTVSQTLPLDSDLAQGLIADIEDQDDVDAGITEATPEARASEMRQSIIDLMKALMSMIAELRYWKSVR
jgi:hypothetical protein